MNDDLPKIEKNAEALWRFVRLSDYSIPQGLTKEKVRKGLRGLWDTLRPSSSRESAVIPDENLHSLPRALLDRLAPPPDWQEPVPALKTALHDWLDTERQDSRLQVIVGAPYSGVQQVVANLAKDQGFLSFEPPGPGKLFENQDEWLRELGDSDETRLAIPNLERFYLRHHEGLKLIRLLTDWLWSSGRRCLIGCDSWAWAYFCKAFQLDILFPPALTLDALDQERLKHWLQRLKAPSGKQSFVFRQTDDCSYVLPPDNEAGDNASNDQEAKKRKDAGDNSPPVSDFLNHMSAYCRGIPGVAWAAWRQSLQRTPDETAQEKMRESPEIDFARTIWVKPWSKLSLPDVPGRISRNELFVLHALLLHDGLPHSLLSQVIPISPAEVSHSIQHLNAAGLIETTNGMWRVTPQGYPAVRRFLKGEGYLTDAI